MKLRPEVVFVKYDTDQHRRLLNAVKQRVQMSQEKMSERHSVWAEQEKIAQAYTKPTESDTIRRDAKDDGKPQYTTLVIPYSMAQLLTMHTYWTSAFLARSPVMQYTARHGEKEMQVRAVEALIDYQNQVGGWMVPLYIWLMDKGKYGLGVIGHHWAEEYAITSQVDEVEVTYFGIKTGAKKKQRTTVRIPGYKGNKLFNVRPQDWLPDPRVSIANFQKGEFCGHRSEVSWNTVLKKQADGFYFNVEEARRTLPAANNRIDGSSQLLMPDAMDAFYTNQQDDSQKATKPLVELIELVVELVPRDWGLGESTYPEKWVLTMLNDKVIVSAQPQGLYHNQYPYDVLEYEIEGYALSKRSVLETLQPLNDTLSWLFNSHMFNVRKVLNDQLVVDPSRVVMRDLMDPNAGRLIRLKPDYYGTDPSMAVHQMTVADVTRTHMQDAMMVIDIMQRITGANDNAMGMVNAGGRKTATEVRTSSSFSVNRMKTSVEYDSAMGFTPLGQKMLQNTQQLYDGDQQYKIAGTLLGKTQTLQVTPDLIAGAYDFVPVDGSMPIDRFAQASLWKELFMVFLKAPQLAQSYDLPGIMSLVAWLSGVKNLDQYRLEVQPDGAVDQGITAGNLVPLKGVPNGAGQGTGETARDFSQISQVGSIPGVGRAA